MEWLKTSWDFVVNPPVEVTTALVTYAKDVGTCVLNATATLGQTVVDLIKGVV